MKKVFIKEIGKVITGNTPSKKNEEFYDTSDIGFVKPDGIAATGITLVTDTKEYISEKARKKARVVKKGTVLVTCIGNIGKMGIVESDELAFNQQINAIAPNDSVLSKYLAYNILSNKRKLESIANAPVVPIINKTQFENFEITIHDKIEEQENIVGILDKLTRIIDHKKQQLDEYDHLIKSRFVELFGYPVSNNMKWETKTMGDVAPTIQYKGDYSDEVWLLNLDMVEAQTGRIVDYNIVGKDQVGNSTGTFDTSNVLYSKLRPYLNKVVLPDRVGYATSELVPLQPVKEILNREYLAYMLRSDEFVNMITEKVAGAKMPRVSMKDFRSFPVPLPPIQLQSQFTVFVQHTDKLKAEVQKSLDAAQVLFNSLMQEYFE